MKIVKQNDDYNLLVSQGELSMLNNCLNEALILVDEMEFQTRVGAEMAIVDALLDEINDAFNDRQTKAKQRISRLDNQYDIPVSRHEMEVMANCIREVLGKLLKDSLESRVGEKVAVVRGYLRQIKEAISLG